MVVAVVAVRVVKMALDPVIHMVTVRHRLMPAARPVHMAGCMTAAAMVGGAAIGVGARHLDHVLVDVTLVRVMEMTVMQIVDVIAMAHGGMAAARAMTMVMMLMGRRRTICHWISFPCSRLSAAWSMALRINSSTWSSASA